MHRLSLVFLALSLAAGQSLAAPPAPSDAATEAASPAGPAWRSFGKAAFDEAASSNRLVLLYVSAPWSLRDHTMETATLTDPKVLDVIRKHYVPVKVDTDQRPDIFGRYGLGAWPTTTVLLPGGLPFFHPGLDGKSANRAGGTFYSPSLFVAYFTQLAEYYEKNEDLVKSVSETTSKTVLSRINVDRGTLDPGGIEVIVGKILDKYKDRPITPEPGAYLPDFPMVNLAWYYWEKKADRAVLDVALNHLTDLARGGIYDRLGGGFFRMAEDSMFRVPEFEKLPSVNASALDAYLDAYEITHNGIYLTFARGTMDWFQHHDWNASEHAFMGAMNAWNDQGSGAEYYTWSEKECKDLLTPEEFGVVSMAYDIAPLGELADVAPRANVIYMRAGPKILSKVQKIDEEKVRSILDAGTEKLLEARRKRHTPEVDPTTYSDWSGRAIASFIHAGRVLKQPEYIDQALAALDVLLDKCRRDDGLMAHACVPAKGERSAEGFLADSDRVAGALVDAYEQTGKPRYLDAAKVLAGGILDKFRDALSGGFSDREVDPNGIGLMAWPLREMDEDMSTVVVLIRLSHLTGEESYRNAARKVLESWADEAGTMGAYAASYGLAEEKYDSPPLTILVAADESKPGAEDLRSEALRLYHPWRVVRSFNLDDGVEEMKRRGMAPAPQGATAAVALCFQDDCAGPYAPGEDLSARLRDFLRKGASKKN